MDDWLSLIRGEIPPWVMRFIKQVGRGINRHSMIREDERVLLSISGGKDSLALALALALRLKWLPINYTMEGLITGTSTRLRKALEELALLMPSKSPHHRDESQYHRALRGV